MQRKQDQPFSTYLLVCVGWGMLQPVCNCPFYIGFFCVVKRFVDCVKPSFDPALFNNSSNASRSMTEVSGSSWTTSSGMSLSGMMLFCFPLPRCLNTLECSSRVVRMRESWRRASTWNAGGVFKQRQGQIMTVVRHNSTWTAIFMCKTLLNLSLVHLVKEVIDFMLWIHFLCLNLRASKVIWRGWLGNIS